MLSKHPFRQKLRTTKSYHKPMKTLTMLQLGLRRTVSHLIAFAILNNQYLRVKCSHSYTQCILYFQPKMGFVQASKQQKRDKDYLTQSNIRPYSFTLTHCTIELTDKAKTIVLSNGLKEINPLNGYYQSTIHSVHCTARHLSYRRENFPGKFLSPKGSCLKVRLREGA